MPVRMTPIVPRKGFLGDVNKLERAIEQALDDTADYTLNLHEKTSATWSDKPNYYVHKTKAGRTVGTRHKVWSMLNKGTRPHSITPKRAKVLRFNTGFKPKTRPGFIGSNGGSPGRTPVFTRRVMHPGTEAREWTAAIAEKTQPELGRNMRKNLKGLFK